MAANKTDPRVIKTRNSLRKALVYLMRREKLEDISVQKITETANITRGTFYLHYKDNQPLAVAPLQVYADSFIYLCRQWIKSESESRRTGSNRRIFRRIF